jgi:Cu/Ag efflux protein CusF
MKFMSRFRRAMIVAVAAGLALAGLALAQSKGKKSYVLQGKVEAVNESGKSLTVNHAKIEGYMDAMTMSYKVDQADVFKKVKSGDQIKATVYEGDYTLYNVEVVPPGGAGTKK